MVGKISLLNMILGRKKISGSLINFFTKNFVGAIKISNSQEFKFSRFSYGSGLSGVLLGVHL